MFEIVIGIDKMQSNVISHLTSHRDLQVPSGWIGEPWSADCLHELHFCPDGQSLPPPSSSSSTFFSVFIVSFPRYSCSLNFLSHWLYSINNLTYRTKNRWREYENLINPRSCQGVDWFGNPDLNIILPGSSKYKCISAQIARISSFCHAGLFSEALVIRPL